ncbi:MAG: tRNA-dihydrouridine synthase family protein [Planctomycetota bacterium]|jgi:tRNA-dihydrouridine synthase 3
MEFRDRLFLSPLTRGGHLPFRRLCVHLGAEVTCSEMAYARQVMRGRGPEHALLRSHASEPDFGVQLALKSAKDGIEAGKIAIEAGAKYIDINCGCPIHDVLRRGMGANLLKRPAALGRIVEEMKEALPVPITVKIRAGWSEEKIRALELAKAVEEGGASALTIHPRTREQRYTRSADWNLVGELVAARAGDMPIIGNGDILTWYEAEQRQALSSCDSLMVARGALIKPWIFREMKDRREWCPSAEERVGVYRLLVEYMREHFGADARGRKKAMYFLPWHFSFFCRYRPLPREEFEASSREHPLLQTRLNAGDQLDPLEVLLRDTREALHADIAGILWDAEDDAQALARLRERADRLEPDEGEGLEIAVAQG